MSTMLKRFSLMLMVCLGLYSGSAQEAKTHVVVQNETLSQIARKYDVQLQLILEWNNRTLANGKPVPEIIPGDTLIVGWNQNPVANTETTKQTPSKEGISSQYDTIWSNTPNVTLTIDSTTQLAPCSDDDSLRFTWSSSNPKVVYVDSTGVITTLAEGKARIVAQTPSGTKYTWKIKVVNKDNGSFLKKFLIYIVVLAIAVAIIALSWGRISNGLLNKRNEGHGKSAVNDYELELQVNALKRDKQSLLAENKRLQQENNKLKTDFLQLKEQYNNCLEENIALGEQLDALKTGNKKVVVNQASEQGGKSQPSQMSSSMVLYADAIVDGYFMRVKEVEGDDAVFELHLNGQNSAEFVICSRAENRVIANPSFIDGCEKQILPNATVIEIVAPGVANKNADSGKWEITQKLKINIK